MVNLNPELQDKTLKTGNLGLNYYDVITATVQGSSNNNDYVFDYDISGLPNGIMVNAATTTLILEGTPIEKGTFTISVQLSVFDSRNVNDLENPSRGDACKDSTSRQYTLEIK
ncbi:hypothetical protein [Hyunsoonleella rubra]|uniref:Uncharacterized protein n=1 Tax=Hyunsoonleella rubra TaxID=1737062 RepID=A0ABW5TD81_9FLAO